MAAIMTSYRSIVSLGKTLGMTSIGVLSLVFSPHSVCVISMNPGRGHGGMWSVIDWGGIHSQGGVGGASALVVAHMAVAVGQPSLQVIDRDPLGQALLLWV